MIICFEYIYGLSHPQTNMQNILHAVSLNVPSENKIVQFDRDPTVFRELNVFALGGINVNQNLTTTNGKLQCLSHFLTKES